MISESKPPGDEALIVVEKSIGRDSRKGQGGDKKGHRTMLGLELLTTADPNPSPRTDRFEHNLWRRRTRTDFLWQRRSRPCDAEDAQQGASCGEDFGSARPHTLTPNALLRLLRAYAVIPWMRLWRKERLLEWLPYTLDFAGFEEIHLKDTRSGQSRFPSVLRSE